MAAGKALRVWAESPPPRDPFQAPWRGAGKKRQTGPAVTQRNGQKMQRMMDFINDHFSNAYVF